jgi:sodium/pantothenate symporter
MSIYFWLCLWSYARLTFPDLTVDGKSLKMDEIIPTMWLLNSVGAGVLVVVGLISAGLSTLESLIQSLSITITTDIIGTISPKSKENHFNQ